MDSELIYIDPVDEEMPFYRQLLKFQGEDICRGQLDKSYISKAISNCTFGYISISQRANIGRVRMGREHRYHVNGFILCSYNPNDPRFLSIEIVCSRREKRLGKMLMKQVEMKALEMGVDELSLFCIAEEPLREWYESLGFRFIKDIDLYDNMPKVYFMKKAI